MATGMVLIIVSRNIDLSVGSLLGFLGYTMAMVQAIWIPTTHGLGFQQPYTWIVALAVGVAIGAAIGGFQGFVVAYGGVPSFIVTLGGLLVWRGLIFRYAQGQTLAPLNETFQLLEGGPKGSLRPSSAGSSEALPAWGSSTRSGPAGARRPPISRSARSGRRSSSAPSGSSWSLGAVWWPTATRGRRHSPASTRWSTGSPSRRAA
jgi:hypothetical protein